MSTRHRSGAGDEILPDKKINDRRLGRILRISVREWRIMRSRAIYLFITLVLPVATFLIFIAIFSAGVIRDLPVVLVDMDRRPCRGS
jgi:hypothetical protein